MGCDDVLLSAKGFKSTVLGRFWHSRGNSKACNCHRFLRLDSASSGPKAIVHFTLMRLRQHKITTCSVYTATVLALHRLAAPRAPETNLKFQISDQRWSLCIPCICDCCSIGVKITTCMDMHGSALVYIIQIANRPQAHSGKHGLPHPGSPTFGGQEGSRNDPEPQGSVQSSYELIPSHMGPFQTEFHDCLSKQNQNPCLREFV